ncbi:DUF6470 family protein [Niallia oryzisoli]|uniref:DUF6470 family protein n=1 Tax=Niallia oryzisoli TaxID=1737571 RepID=A0ABZ2CDK8_9BACI
MQIPQIVMQSRFAQIDISTTPSQQTIEQPKAQLSLQQPKAEMILETTPGQLSIDQTRAWESMNIKHIFRRIEENAQKGINDALNGTARRATEGEEMMRIENGGSAIASQATRNSQLLNYDYNIGLVPPPFSVKMNYQPGHLTIQVEPKQVINNTVAEKPVIDYQKGQVNIRMKQNAELNIDFKM